jgi:GNAT superfamily N-acetyltransferase
MDIHSAAPAPPFPAGTALEVRSARWRDVPEMSRLYRGQNAVDRRNFHPLPFGRPRLGLLLRALITAAPVTRRTVAWLPRATALLVTGRAAGGGPVVGIGLMRFRRAADGVLVVETGYLVDSNLRQRGFGRAIKVALLEEARKLGARRAETIILRTNVPSLRLNQSLGFELLPVAAHDAHLPGGEFVQGKLDLDGWDAARPVRRSAGDHTTV